MSPIITYERRADAHRNPAHAPCLNGNGNALKERSISLEKDLMILGQEPMDEPNSSTTVELRRISAKTGRTARLEPSALPWTAAPEVPIAPASASVNPYAPVEYGYHGGLRMFPVAVVAVGAVMSTVGLLAGGGHAGMTFAGMLLAAAAWPLHGWLDELERDRAVGAVEGEYGIHVLQTVGGGGTAAVLYSAVLYSAGRGSAVGEGVVAYGRGLAWLYDADGSRIVGRGE